MIEEVLIGEEVKIALNLLKKEKWDNGNNTPKGDYLKMERLHKKLIFSWEKKTLTLPVGRFIELIKEKEKRINRLEKNLNGRSNKEQVEKRIKIEKKCLSKLSETIHSLQN